MQPGELVLEVGPGTGTLTEALLDAGARVVACEIDPEMAAIVEGRLASEGAVSRFRLVRGDCLDGKRALHPELRALLADQPFVLVANLPYGAATPLMATLLVEHEACRGLFVTVQREVADRLLAEAGTKEYGPISVLARTLATVELISILPGSCFWPAPEVTSAMVAIRRRPPQEIAAAGGPTSRDERESLASFAARLFTTRRKQLGNVLEGIAVVGGAMPAGLDLRRRAETLTPEEVVDLWIRATCRRATDTPGDPRP